MIISGGFNVFPSEVEHVVVQHPGVQDCAVVGVPDAKWGEAVMAAVQLRPGARVTDAELIEYCRKTLGGVKTPKSIEFLETLPRSGNGKVLRRVIREPYWAGHDRAI